MPPPTPDVTKEVFEREQAGTPPMGETSLNLMSQLPSYPGYASSDVPVVQVNFPRDNTWQHCY